MRREGDDGEAETRRQIKPALGQSRANRVMETKVERERLSKGAGDGRGRMIAIPLMA